MAEEYDLLTHGAGRPGTVPGTARGYLLEGDLTRLQAERLAERTAGRSRSSSRKPEPGQRRAAQRSGAGGDRSAAKPGVMDPAAQSVLDAARDLGHRSKRSAPFAAITRIRGGRASTRYTSLAARNGAGQRRHRAGRRRAADAGTPGPRQRRTRSAWSRSHCATWTTPRWSSSAARASSSLSLAEMQADPGPLSRSGPRPDRRRTGDARPDLVGALLAQDAQGPRSTSNGRRIDNLLKETIFAATQEIRRRSAGRLVRQRLRGQRRRRPLRRRSITSASRSRRTTIPRPSSPTAAPTPASAASSATRSAPAWAPSRSATPTSSASPRRTRRRRRCRRACCIRAR